MIEILEGFPDDVVAFAARGCVTKGDYDGVLIPKVRQALGRREKIRLYYELGPDFSGIEPGAAWEDLKLGMDYLSRWAQVAVVTDVGWIRLAVNMFRFLVPAETRIFAASEAPEARRWISVGDQSAAT